MRRYTMPGGRLAPPVAAALLAFQGTAIGADFEPPTTFQAFKVVPAALLRGPHHAVAEPVQAEGFYQTFHVKSAFGDIRAEGRTVLRTRVSEVDALQRLSEVSRGEIFARAAGGAVLNVGKGVAAVVTAPAETVKGLGAGIKRFGVNLGRKGKRAADAALEDDKKRDGPDRPAEDKALGAAGGAANSVLGVNGAARRWAQKLGVDPYTSNPVLHKALVDVGKIDAAGSIITKIVVPIPPIVSTTATAGGLVWSADPEALRKSNEAHLADLGASKDVAGRFLINGNYTLTSQTRFITALYAVQAKGCADYIDSASEAEDEREALFFVESAELLAGLHESRPVTAILEDSRAMIARTGTSAIALLPFDWVRWTQSLQEAALDVASRARRELGASALHVHVSGQVSPTAKAELAALGWTVKEHAAAGLAIPPAD